MVGSATHRTDRGQGCNAETALLTLLPIRRHARSIDLGTRDVRQQLARGICNFAGAAGGDCGNYWTALSALATGLAVIVALVLPVLMARREWKRRDAERRQEWARQDQIKADEQAQRKAERISIIREICSAVDQVLAYRQAAIAIARTNPPFHEPMQAFERISHSVTTLSEMLNILKGRREISDGSAYSAVAAQRIAAVVIEQTKNSVGLTANDWINRAAAMEALQLQADLIASRVAGVRAYAGLSASTSAAAIKAKYEAICAETLAALAAQRAPVFAPLNDNRY